MGQTRKKTNSQFNYGPVRNESILRRGVKNKVIKSFQRRALCVVDRVSRILSHINTYTMTTNEWGQDWHLKKVCSW